MLAADEVAKLPRVSAAMSATALKAECKARDIKGAAALTKDALLHRLGVGTIALSSTAEYKRLAAIRAAMAAEANPGRAAAAAAKKTLATAARRDAATAKKAAADAEKTAAAQRADEIARQAVLHTDEAGGAVPPGLHGCARLAPTAALQLHGRPRTGSAVCNVRGVGCVSAPAFRTCEGCDFDVCEACASFARLPASEQAARRRARDDAERERAKERARVVAEEERVVREWMTQQERARKRLREEAAEEAKRARRKRDEDERRVETAVAGTAEAVRKPDARHRDKAAPLAFVVWTSCGYRPDGWHSYDGPPPKEFDSSFATKKEANDRVRYRFYAKNTWGLGVREMMEQEVEEKERGGLLTLSTTPPDSECWTVAAVPAEAFQFLSDVDEDDGGGSDDIRYDDDDGPSDDDDDGGGGVGGRRRYDFLL